MPPPLPLTAAPTPQLNWSRGAVPASQDFDDIYFSTDGGLEESQTVFLKGCGLPERWQDGQDHVIGELGFGSGLNFLTAWQVFEQSAAPHQNLYFISVEKFPFTADMLEKALAHWPQLADKSSRLIAQWPGPVKGLHRLHLTPRVTLTLYIEDVETALNSMSGLIDSWFLDGFSPQKNQAMWSAGIMKALAARSHNQTRLATFTVAGDVRRALIEAGFDVTKQAGFGRKRHRLEVHFTSGPVKPTRPHAAPIIIGGGIAGASLCRAAHLSGLAPTLIHDDPDMTRAASGNPAALVKPRLDLQDRPESRFFLASYLYALRAYEDAHKHSPIIHARGIMQIAKTPSEMARFKKITAQAPLPPAHLQPHDKGLNFPNALSINPKAVTAQWTQGTNPNIAAIKKISQSKGQWQAHDHQGHIIAASEIMIIASGVGVRDIYLPSGDTIAAHLSLRFSRGQLTWAEDKSGDVIMPTAYGGYALPLRGDVLLGATHDRLDERDDYALRPEDDQHNIALAHNYLNPSIKRVNKDGRVSLRVTTANTLPLIAEIGPGLWVMTGLGSRGFVFAPLLADHLISRILRKTPSLTPQLWDKLSRI